MEPVSRRKDYKKTITEADGRRRRQDKSISIRKQKREEGLAKRRGLINNFTSSQGGTDGGASTDPSLSADSIPSLVAGLRATDPDMVLTSTRSLRKLLSAEVNPPVEETIQQGAVPILVHLLANPAIQFEAAWTLTNIASTDHTGVVVSAGAVPSLIGLMASNNPDVREQAAWCIGNIAGDCTGYRDVCLAAGGMQALLLNIAHPVNTSMLRNCVWTLSNFCRGKPAPALGAVSPAIPALIKVLESEDSDVLMDACWALSYISDGDDERIQACVSAGLVPLLVHHLGSEYTAVKTPALRTVGNLVSGDDEATQAVVNAGAARLLLPLLGEKKRSLRKEAAWAISNIAAGSRAQIGHLLSVPGLVGAIIVAAQEDEWEVRKEAAWVLSNICSGGSTEHINELVDNGVIPTLVGLMEAPDSKIVLVSLEAISAVLATTNTGGRPGVLDALEECRGIETIEELQTHENQEIYMKAAELIETYFSGESEDDEAENLAPATAEGAKTFAFGAPQQQMVVQNNGACFGGAAAAPAAGAFATPAGGFNFGGAAAAGTPTAPLGESNNANMFGGGAFAPPQQQSTF